jgi:hypothetical protein
MLQDEIDRVLQADETSLDDLSLDQIRDRRAACTAVEAKVSYLRRLIHGATDIVNRELARRSEGTAAADASSLVDELADALAANVHGGGGTRFVTNLLPPDIDAVTTELDGIVDRRALSALPEVSDDELRDFAGRLAEADRTLSRDRGALHDRIDALADELTRRYKAGEADVESVLP